MGKISSFDWLSSNNNPNLESQMNNPSLHLFIKIDSLEDGVEYCPLFAYVASKIIIILYKCFLCKKKRASLSSSFFSSPPPCYISGWIADPATLLQCLLTTTQLLFQPLTAIRRLPATMTNNCSSCSLPPYLCLLSLLPLVPASVVGKGAKIHCHTCLCLPSLSLATHLSPSSVHKIFHIYNLHWDPRLEFLASKQIYPWIYIL